MNCPIHLFSPISTAHHCLLPLFTKPGASAAAVGCVCWPEGSEAGPMKDDVQKFVTWLPLSQSSFLDSLHFHHFFLWVHKLFLVKLRSSTCHSSLHLDSTTWWSDNFRAFKPDIFPSSLTCGYLQCLVKISWWFVCPVILGHPKGDAFSCRGEWLGLNPPPSLLWSNSQDPKLSQWLRVLTGNQSGTWVWTFSLLRVALRRARCKLGQN